jgi:hypothetical protein
MTAYELLLGTLGIGTLHVHIFTENIVYLSLSFVLNVTEQYIASVIGT